MASQDKASALDLSDIQGIALSSYGNKPHARFVFLSMGQGARGFFASLGERITSARSPKPSELCLNVAFTSPGLAALGLDETSLNSFPSEFVEGMADEGRRTSILGDTGKSAPELWLWGSKKKSVDAVLMLYARELTALDRAHLELKGAYEGAVEEVYARTTVMLPEDREHFGFRDGISQPRMAGHPGDVGMAPPGADALPAGEFILGYPSAYGTLPASPSKGAEDIGRNGTYLVFRQIDQDVTGFWNTLLDRAGGNPSEAVRLGAKCVGRWPSGAPLVLAKEQDRPEFSRRNDFGYAKEDPRGLACPVASHIRRTNPRDSLPPDAEESLKVSAHHALIRRGRPYGEPLERFKPDDKPQERGLMFICVNASIERQFEFVQQTWINNPKFDGLYDDRDPLLGSHDEKGGTFTMPAKPIRERLIKLPRFTQVRGGGYFFLPSLSAYRKLLG